MVVIGMMTRRCPAPSDVDVLDVFLFLTNSCTPPNRPIAAGTAMSAPQALGAAGGGLIGALGMMKSLVSQRPVTVAAQPPVPAAAVAIPAVHFSPPFAAFPRCISRPLTT